jgi:hypothetical protein
MDAVQGLDAAEALDGATLVPDTALVRDTGTDTVDGASDDVALDAATHDAGPRNVLRGYAQKGPFIAGSRVTIIALDSELFPTGATYLTETVGVSESTKCGRYRQGTTRSR